MLLLGAVVVFDEGEWFVVTANRESDESRC